MAASSTAAALKKTPINTTRIKLNPSFWNHNYCVPYSEDIVPSSLFLKNKHYLILDIETQRLFQEVGGPENMHKLGVSVAGTFDSKSGEFKGYLESQLEELFSLCRERLVIGYNIRGFDLPVLSAYGLDPTALDVFDIMYDLETLTRQRYLKLETVAQGTLGVGKSADGLQAVKWWKEGKVQQVMEYCLQDVKVTRDIFEYGRKQGLVKISRVDGPKDVPVQWN